MKTHWNWEVVSEQQLGTEQKEESQEGTPFTVWKRDCSTENQTGSKYLN